MCPPPRAGADPVSFPLELSWAGSPEVEAWVGAAHAGVGATMAAALLRRGIALVTGAGSGRLGLATGAGSRSAGLVAAAAAAAAAGLGAALDLLIVALVSSGSVLPLWLRMGPWTQEQPIRLPLMWLERTRLWVLWSWLAIGMLLLLLLQIPPGCLLAQPGGVLRVTLVTDTLAMLFAPPSKHWLAGCCDPIATAYGAACFNQPVMALRHGVCIARAGSWVVHIRVVYDSAACARQRCYACWREGYARAHHKADGPV